LASIHRVSTAAVPPSQRLVFWKDVCASAYRPMVVDADPIGFDAVLTRLCAGELEIVSAKSTPLATRSGPQRGGDEGLFTLQVVHSGRCRIRHANVETFAQTGDMIIADGSKGYELAFAEPVHGLVVSLPWSRFRGHADVLEGRAGHRININSGPGAVLSTFIRSAWDQLVEYRDEDWPQSAAEVMWNLLESVLERRTVRESSTWRADELRHAASAVVEHHLRDPGFRSSAIAEALGVSARYLQLLFAEVGTTPSRFLLAKRLDAAAARLRLPNTPCSITEVALECGLNDLSYFSRAFRRRFGMSASEYRLRSGARSGDWI
jgi:AraC family transcriptional activator of tynA and feaB